MADKNDEEIALSVQNGSIQDFGILVDRYEGKLMRYAKRFLFSNDDAKDLVQDVFIKTYVNIRSFDAEKKFSSWIYRIAHNEFVNEIKKRQSRITIPIIFDSDAIFPHLVAKESVEGESERKETRRILEENLGKLGVKYREPLVLYYFEDMDYGEISDILGIPVSTVGVRLRRGKEMLKKHMNPQDKNGK